MGKTLYQLAAEKSHAEKLKSNQMTLIKLKRFYPLT